MIEGTLWAQLGPAGLIVTVVVFGFLVPRWTVNRWLKDRDDQIKYLHSMVDKRDEQFDKLLTQGELNTRLLEDLKEAASKTGATGSGHT